jgi:two-component system sensor histidine kinase KdpD
VLGLFTVAGLAYWGHMYRSAPQWAIAIAAVAALGSLLLAWGNLRHVAQLSGAVTEAEADSRRRELAASERVQEYAALLAETSSALARQVDEIRLPLHILLANHFGDLNENQEEMLAAAKSAAEAAAVELERLKEIADLDRGALRLRREPIRIATLLDGLRPILQADAERTRVTVVIDVDPRLPRVAGDRVRLQEALAILLRHAVRQAVPGTKLLIAAACDGSDVSIDLGDAAATTLDADVALARRVILAHGGRLEPRAGGTRLRLPAAPPL